MHGQASGWLAGWLAGERRGMRMVFSPSGHMDFQYNERCAWRSLHEAYEWSMAVNKGRVYFSITAHGSPGEKKKKKKKKKGHTYRTHAGTLIRFLFRLR